MSPSLISGVNVPLSFDTVVRRYPTISLVCFWGLGMLSYHQDAKHRLNAWALLSQLFSVICLIALVVFGFTQHEWANFIVVPPLVWLHVQFTKRWWARPEAWW